MFVDLFAPLVFSIYSGSGVRFFIFCVRLFCMFFYSVDFLLCWLKIFLCIFCRILLPLFVFNLNCSHSVCVLREFFKKVFLLVVFVINNIPSTHSRQPKNQVEKSIHDNNIDIDDIVPTTNKTKLKHSQKRAKKKMRTRKCRSRHPFRRFSSLSSFYSVPQKVSSGFFHFLCHSHRCRCCR